MPSKEEYRRIAEKYKPEEIKVLFVAEAPPKPRKRGFGYFYKERYFGNESLFTHLMGALYQDYSKDKDKREFLSRFCDDGYYLVDLSEEPLDKSDKYELYGILCGKIEDFLCRLEGLIEKKTPILLIKYNVHGLLNRRLRKEGYKVINREKINFPTRPKNIEAFREKIEKLLPEIKRCSAL